MKYLSLAILALSFLSGSLAYASLSPLDASPNIPSLCKISNTTHVLSCAGIEDTFNMTGSNGIKIKLDNNTHTITVVGVTQNSNHGTYNQTYANNVLVNSGGHRFNFLNGTNSTIDVVNDPTRNQVNITISSTGGSGTSGVSSLNALTGALTIACVAGNTTCTTSGGNTITINTAYNIATLNLNEIFSGITTMNNLKLGGQMNINGQTMQSFGHVYSWQNHTGTVCLTNQTTACGPGRSATYDTMQNVGTGEGSIYKGNSTNTNFQFKTLKQGSHITLTNNTNDVTIATTGLLSSAILSINADTTSAQHVSSGNTNHITVTDIAGGTHNIDIAFKVNNATCSAGYFVSSYSNVTGIYSCSLGNSGTITTASNIGHGGKGFFSSVSGSTIQLRNITSQRTDLITVSQNATDVNLSSSFKSNTISCTNQFISAFSNSTGLYTCTSGNAGTVTGSQNAGKATGSVGVLATPTSTTIKGRNMTGSSPITVTKTNDTDIAISCNTCLTGTKVDSITGTAHNVTASSSTGAVVLNTGDNVVVTGGSAQTISKSITYSADVFMKGKNINFADSSLANSIAINESSDNFGSSTLLMHPSGALPARWTLLPGNGATSNIVTLNRVNSLVNYETLVFGSDIIGSNELAIASYNGGTGTLRPLNFYMLNTKLFSMNTANTITDYVAHIFTPIADVTTANAFWKSSTNADVLKYRDNAGSNTYNILSTLGAVTTSTPADPTGTTSTTAKMMGLAGSITPAVSTRADITICGQMSNSLINDGATVQLRYGTGTAPTNAATLTGTQLGASQTFTALVAAQRDGFCVTGIATGLTIGTTYWIDATLNAITGGTATITGNTIKAHEI